MVDDDDVDGGFGGLQLQAELLLDRVEDVRRGTCIGGEGVGSVGQGEIIPARQSRVAGADSARHATRPRRPAHYCNSLEVVRGVGPIRCYR